MRRSVSLILVLVMLSRLPQLSSPNLLLDGDECVVRLMAKHLYDGKELPLCFYGQSYGFSLIELIAIDFFHVIFGVTDIAIKAAMLVLWSCGVLFFYGTLKEICPSPTPRLLTVILVLSPAWAVWSMKARGGYVTAFALSEVVSWPEHGWHALLTAR